MGWDASGAHVHARRALLPPPLRPRPPCSRSMHRLPAPEARSQGRVTTSRRSIMVDAAGRAALKASTKSTSVTTTKRTSWAATRSHSRTTNQFNLERLFPTRPVPARTSTQHEGRRRKNRGEHSRCCFEPGSGLLRPPKARGFQRGRRLAAPLVPPKANAHKAKTNVDDTRRQGGSTGPVPTKADAAPAAS